MNKATRKKLEAIEDELSELLVKVQSIRDAEQESYDEKSEAWQESERGQEAQEAISALDDLCNSLEEAINSSGVARGEG